jgi:GntP family gluconate:H+ symporter
MTNALVPPTPGPSFVAAELHAGVAAMMLGGLVVSAIAAAAGYAYATWANRRWGVTPDVPPEAPAADGNGGTINLPPLWLSLTPILLPVVLISLNAFLRDPPGAPAWRHAAMQWVHTLGQKNVALALAAATGLVMAAARHGAGRGRYAFVTEALSSAGVMVLIISAGGAFGYVLRQTDIAAALSERLPETRLALLPLAFLLTTLVRVSQGSATVSMIAAAGIVSPIAAGGAEALGYHPVYLAIAIGCGSKPGMWMNDSGFWIIGKMSGFSEAQTLRTATVMMTVMGVTGLAATVLGAWLLPLV